MKLFLLLSLFQINGVLAQEAAVDYSLKTSFLNAGQRPSLVPKTSDNSFTNLTGSGLYGLGSTIAPRSNLLGLEKEVKAQQWHGITCLQQVGLPLNYTLTNLDNNITNAMGLLDCQNISSSKIARFTDENCRLKQSCSQYILSMDIVDNNSSITSDDLAASFIADDYTTYHIESFSVQMDEIDRLREFVEEGPDKNLIPKYCVPKFIPETKHSFSVDKCEPIYMDAAFEKIQDNCKLGKRGCSFSSKDEMKTFVNDWNTFNTMLGSSSAVIENMSRYEAFSDFKKRQYYGTEINTIDKDLIGKLLEIMSTKDSHDKKLNKIFQHLEEEKKKNRLDPVLSYMHDSISSDEAIYKRSPHLNFFKELIQSNSKKDYDAIKNDFVKYRSGAALKILQNDCEKIPSFLDICREATSIARSRGAAYWEASTYLKIEANNGDEFDRFHQLKKARPNGIKDREDYNVIMDAQLCSTFGKGSDFKKYDYSSLGSGYNLSSISSPFQLPLNQSLQKTMDQAVEDYFATENARKKTRDFNESTGRKNAETSKYWQRSQSSESSSHLTNSPFNTKTYDKTKVDESENKAVSNNDNIKSASSTKETTEVTKGSDNVGTEIAKVKEISSENAVSGSGTTVSSSDIGGSTDVGSSMRNINSPSTFSNQSYSNVNKKNGSSSEYVSSSSKTGNSSDSNGNLSEKVNDLTRKLASSESNLEKFKAETKAAEEERARQAQAESDAKIIADLQAKLVEANADAKKPAITSSITDKVNSEPVPASFSISPKSIKSETGNKEKEVVAQNNPRDQEVRNNPVASSTIATPTSRNSNASAVSQSGVSSQMAYAPGDSRSSIVLTKMDGLTSENAVEKINEKITSLNGKPFYIEEGGIVKKIIPTIVNDVVAVDEFGKPIYEKIVVGNDEKIALTQGKSQAKAKRAPASISDKADLKRDQEERLKFERAEYLKLRNLTNGILNK